MLTVFSKFKVGGNPFLCFGRKLCLHFGEVKEPGELQPGVNSGESEAAAQRELTQNTQDGFVKHVRTSCVSS